ncbi:MAG: Gp49 family protein [Candidatus Binatia bacterium]
MLTNEQRDNMLNSRPERTVTVEQIKKRIRSTEFIRPTTQSTLTIAVMTLENGFTVVGKSACAHPENFNEELGQKIAYDDAFSQVWALEGYLLREALHIGKRTAA